MGSSISAKIEEISKAVNMYLATSISHFPISRFISFHFQPWYKGTFFFFSIQNFILKMIFLDAVFYENRGLILSTRVIR